MLAHPECELQITGPGHQGVRQNYSANLSSESSDRSYCNPDLRRDAAAWSLRVLRVDLGPQRLENRKCCFRPPGCRIGAPLPDSSKRA